MTATAPKKTIDVTAANDAYAKLLSPELRALRGLDPADGVACGDSRAVMIGRSAARFVREARETARECVATMAQIAEESRNPIYRAAASAFADEMAAHARITTFKTKDALRDAARRASNAVATANLSKFVEPGSRLAVLGKPKVLATAIIVGTLMMTGLTTTGVVAQSHDLGIDTSSYSRVGRTAETFPIEMRQSSAGFASRVSMEMPSERFKEEALAALTLDFGDEVAAKEHLDLALGILNTCVELPVPCTVHTAGLDLDPVHGRYLVSSPDAEGIYNYAFMNYDGQDVPLMGQDGDEAVKNPYSWKP